MNNGKFYIITLDKDGYPKTFVSKKFHNELTTTNGIIAWWHYLESTYIVKVSNTTYANHIADLMKKIAPNKKYFTSEINLIDFNGWLPAEAWDWIRENTKHNNV